MKKQRQSTVRALTTEQVAPLAALEEKVVRMRQGMSAPSNLVLETLGERDPALRARLLEIERRVLQAARDRAADQPPPSTKQKIVALLRSKKTR